MAPKKKAELEVAELVAVRFVTYDAPFISGQTESFAPATAARLVASGVAQYVEEPKG